jgi:hypothetical protein
MALLATISRRDRSCLRRYRFDAKSAASPLSPLTQGEGGATAQLASTIRYRRGGSCMPPPPPIGWSLGGVPAGPPVRGGADGLGCCWPPPPPTDWSLGGVPGRVPGLPPARGSDRLGCCCPPPPPSGWLVCADADCGIAINAAASRPVVRINLRMGNSVVTPPPMLQTAPDTEKFRVPRFQRIAAGRGRIVSLIGLAIPPLRRGRRHPTRDKRPVRACSCPRSRSPACAARSRLPRRG